MNQTRTASPEIDFNEPRLKRHRSIRAFKDQLARVSIGAGGMSVIVAVLLIFFYLLYEVLPLFQSASAKTINTYAVPEASKGTSLFTAVEEQGEIAVRMTDQGEVVFFGAADGAVRLSQHLPIPPEVTLTSIAEAGASSGVLAAGLSNGSVLVFKYDYAVSYPNDQRVITPRLSFPYGESAIALDPSGGAITKVALRDNDNGLFIVGANQANRLFSEVFDKSRNFMTGAVTLTESDVTMPSINGHITGLQVDPDTRWLYVANDLGKLDMFDLRDRNNPELNSRVDVSAQGARISDMQFLLGGISLIIADTQGNMSQWFPVRNPKNEYSLQKIRSFEGTGSQVLHIVPEHRRKDFVTVDAKGQVAIYNSTANRQVLLEQVAETQIQQVTIAPRANFALFETANGDMQFWSIDNPHPEVSWSSLWGKVWYEGYAEPAYIWQSSAANDDFEPKFSLTPLAFGTLKAAFYAMLLAMPIAIAGAVYTAYFMSPGVRRKVKPSIELMEALPTVILGFLAGLFLAPFMESNLPGVFAILILLPLAILAFAYTWANLPEGIRHKLPEGWEPFLLVPVILGVGWLSFEMSDFVEIWFFGGDIRFWLTNEMGLGYDQRNALVVGAAMGFAVIPTIFSITEDAVFSVPKHLTYGSLALGATPWQTLTRVVLPTASPGIFSALMIGLGRAVGETMIVLMATGNTPVMDVNIFQGMRTLSANIAVEMPESVVGSTHFRILFLAAFVLFMFTFVVNTLAEFIRQRLRKKYSVI